MDGKVLAILIVIVVFASMTMQQWLKHKADMANKQLRDDDETDELKAEIADLKERVQVLERIATDKGSRLKEEIDAL